MDPSSNKMSNLTIRVWSSDRQSWRDKAAAAGMTLNQYITHVLNRTKLKSVVTTEDPASDLAKDLAREPRIRAADPREADSTIPSARGSLDEEEGKEENGEEGEGDKESPLATSAAQQESAPIL